MSQSPPRSATAQWGFKGQMLLLLALVVALAPVVIILLQLSNRVGLQNVTRYEQSVYYPTSAELCPGDQLVFTPTLVVTGAPLLVKITSTWWDAHNNRTAVQAKHSDIVVSIFRENGPVSRRITVDVPVLPPGNYEYLRATESTAGSQAAITTIPFVVPGDCANR